MNKVHHDIVGRCSDRAYSRDQKRPAKRPNKHGVKATQALSTSMRGFGIKPPAFFDRDGAVIVGGVTRLQALRIGRDR